MARLPSPLDQPGRLEEDRLLGELAIALVEGEKGDPGQYTDRLGAILRRMDAQLKPGKASPAIERTLEATRLMVCEAYLKAGKLAELRELLSRLPDESSDQPQTLVQRAELFESMGLTDRADAHWTRALAVAPDDLVIVRTGNVLMTSGWDSRRSHW